MNQSINRIVNEKGEERERKKESKDGRKGRVGGGKKERKKD